MWWFVLNWSSILLYLLDLFLFIMTRFFITFLLLWTFNCLIHYGWVYSFFLVISLGIGFWNIYKPKVGGQLLIVLRVMRRKLCRVNGFELISYVLWDLIYIQLFQVGVTLHMLWRYFIDGHYVAYLTLMHIELFFLLFNLKSPFNFLINCWLITKFNDWLLKVFIFCKSFIDFIYQVCIWELIIFYAFAALGKFLSY